MEIAEQQRCTGPGPVVLDVTASDEHTAIAAMEVFHGQRTTCGIVPVWRTPGEPRVRMRVYADGPVRRRAPADRSSS